MNHTEFFKQLKQNELSSVYLFCGEEHFVCASALSQLENALVDENLKELNCTILDAPDADTVIQACQTIPFCAEKRLVIVKDFSLLSANGASGGEEALCAYLANPSQTCVLVFVCVNPDKRRKAYKAIAKHSVVEFNTLNSLEAQKWAIQFLKREGILLSPEDAAFLCEYTSPTPTVLAPELEKLISYVKNSTVTRQDILDVVIPQTDFNVFKMVDLIVAEQKTEALKILGTMLCSREDPVFILAAISRQFALLLAFSQLEKSGTSKGEIIKILGIRDFLYPKMSATCKKKSQAQLKAAVDLCHKTDLGLKSGTQFVNAALHKLIIELCKI